MGLQLTSALQTNVRANARVESHWPTNRGVLAK